MTACRALGVLGVVSALAGTPTLAVGQTAGDWKKALKDAFEQSLYQKTNTASLELNKITQAGTVLIVQQDGLLAGRSHTIGPPLVTKIKNGQAKSQGGLGGLFRKTLGGSSHPLKQGDRVYLYGVDVDDESIVLKLLTSDLADIVEDDGSTNQTRFKAAVRFEFPKGYLASADPRQIKTTTIDPFLLPEADSVAAPIAESDAVATATGPETDAVATAAGTDPVLADSGPPALELRKGANLEEVQAMLGAPVSSSTNGQVTTSLYNAASGSGTVEVDYYNGVAVDIRDREAAPAAPAAPALPPSPAPRPTAPQAGAPAPAPAAGGWTLVPASDWRTRAPGLVGQRVELSGNLTTLFAVDPRNNFSNKGWMKGNAARQNLANVLFDQIGDEQVAWMSRNKCAQTCDGVFVRGVVVSGRSEPVLRMIDVSFESRAGGVAARTVQLDSAPSAPPLPPSSAPRPTVPQAGAPAPGASGWTLVPAGTWRARARGLVGQRVELFGDLSTLFAVDPRNSLSNRGWMTGRTGRTLATVRFDQIGNEQIAWMSKNNCDQTCAGVFVRGVVVSARGEPILEMIEISSESRAGGVAASVAQLDSAPLSKHP